METNPAIARAIEVFGDAGKAAHWLATPLVILEDRAPADLLDTEAGAARVEQILGRIEHNIPS